MAGLYAKYIRSLHAAGDYLLLNSAFVFGYVMRFGTLSSFFDNDYLVFILFFNLSWGVMANILSLYDIDRTDGRLQILVRIIRQLVLQFLLVTAFNGLIKTYYSRLFIGYTFGFISVTIPLWRFSLLYGLSRYRLRGYNYRKVVAVGRDEHLSDLAQFFSSRPEYGFRYQGYFGESGMQDHLGDLAQFEAYCIAEEVDEVYCFVGKIDAEVLSRMMEFADNHLIRLNFLPEINGLQYRKLSVEFYDHIPVLLMRQLPLDDPMNRFLKRMFDLAFSLVVFVLLLSWLLPVMALLIKLGSRGPVFFKQERSGLNNQVFLCYKLRSMYVNEDADRVQARKNDDRITPLGRFMRKTNLDELPQFFNVFKGDMSIVGPRPHMVQHTEEYSSLIDKYMVRHFVKPGITGLSQVKGYRGETEQTADMRNRIRIDIFYLENWSFLLDLKIILQTVVNMVKGEEKAY